MVDINCDMGEGMANDERLMPFISSANIACGYHAGDIDTMRRTVQFCLQHKVAIGAHPSFNDKANFGRTEMALSADEIMAIVYKQLEIINAVCLELGTGLHHVKPHGALYNMAARDASIAAAIAKAVASFNSHLFLYGLSGSHLIKEGNKAGLKTISEVFSDRTYQADGSLTPRSKPNALVDDDDEAIAQVLKMIQQKKVTAANGQNIDIKAETICIHGDGEHAVEIAKNLVERLRLNNVDIKAPL